MNTKRKKQLFKKIINGVIVLLILSSITPNINANETANQIKDNNTSINEPLPNLIITGMQLVQQDDIPALLIKIKNIGTGSVPANTSFDININVKPISFIFFKGLKGQNFSTGFSMNKNFEPQEIEKLVINRLPVLGLKICTLEVNPNKSILEKSYLDNKFSTFFFFTVY